MEIPVLYGLALQQNIPIFAFPLPNTGSMSLMDEQGRCFIGMDAGVRDNGPQAGVSGLLTFLHREAIKKKVVRERSVT